jgi:hypothetical protein
VVRRALLAAGAAGTWLTACVWLADLGPDATLRDAAVDEAPPPPDASDEPEAAPFKCGLPPDPNAACNACNEQYCCPLGIQCNQDPRCVEAINCSLGCVYDPGCIQSCDTRYGDAGVFLTFQSCAIGQCSTVCLPGPECLKLARCCPFVSDTAAHGVCVGTVNGLDENKCQNTLDNVLRQQLGANFCMPAHDAAE